MWCRCKAGDRRDVEGGGRSTEGGRRRLRAQEEVGKECIGWQLKVVATAAAIHHYLLCDDDASSYLYTTSASSGTSNRHALRLDRHSADAIILRPYTL